MFQQILIETAKAEGFPLAGAVDLDRVNLNAAVERYDSWLAKGFAGEMNYLIRGRARRTDPRLVFPEAQSMLCVALPYPAKIAGQVGRARYARYLHGEDYHRTIGESLERVMKKVRERWGKELKWKVCVDTSAILEREWAAQAGLGWIGKNMLLIHPRFGSHLLLGEVLISEKTGQGPNLLPDYCGHCTRCLEACPTRAFEAPRSLDSRKCISYRTLEKRGPLNLSTDEHGEMGTWIAGCDHCQDVCPFNRKAGQLEPPEPEGALRESAWIELLRESDEAYRERVERSALKRVKPEQFRRNLAIAAANAYRTGEIDPRDREAILRLLAQRAESEGDFSAREEWIRARDICADAVPGSESVLSNEVT